MLRATLRATLIAILFTTSAALAACCSAGRGPEPTPARNEVVTEPRPVTTEAPPEPVDEVVTEMEPLPTSFDCNAPPPLTPCCRALLPKCTQCAERNRAIDEAYRAQCGPN